MNPKKMIYGFMEQITKERYNKIIDEVYENYLNPR